jgi:nucleoside-diphosphate-sugar epimerase
MRLRILVAGGGGLIGGPCARALLAAGHDVTVMKRSGRNVPPGAATLVADRSDPASLAATLAGRRFDAVLDLLAFDAGDVERLFAAPGFEIGHYLFISSGQVYLVAADPRPPFVEADAEKPAMPEPDPADERRHGNWSYGMGKRAAERAAREVQARRGVRTTALRLPVVQGANDSSRRLWAYVQRLRDGGPLLLPEGGAHPVRYVWAEDVGRAVVALVDGANAPAPAYNLAQPDEPQLIELVVSMAALLGVPARTVPCTWEQLAEAGIDERVSPYSGPWSSRPDASLAARDFGFRGTPSHDWLPIVVQAHLEAADNPPHPCYANRPAELALAAKLAGI